LTSFDLIFCLSFSILSLFTPTAFFFSPLKIEKKKRKLKFFYHFPNWGFLSPLANDPQSRASWLPDCLGGRLPG
jgi:hypothetical protein